MSAFVIVDIAIENEAQYSKYIALITPSVAAYGGRYRVRGGRPETLDGDWHSERIVVMEFPNRETAKAWLADESLADIHNMRRANASRCNMIVCDTMPPAPEPTLSNIKDEWLDSQAALADIDLQPAWRDMVRQHLDTAAKMAELIDDVGPDTGALELANTYSPDGQT